MCYTNTYKECKQWKLILGILPWQSGIPGIQYKFIVASSYLMKKMPKFCQHFFSNVFNESTDTKTTVQTREKSLYSSYNLRRPQSFQKFTHFEIDRLEFL